MPLTPHFDNIQSEIINTLIAGERSIKAAVAWLTDIHIINILKQQATRGVSIEVIINDDDINKHKELDLQQLVLKGARIYYYPSELGLMHHKFCIIDNQTLIMGSYNWTYSAANINQESIVIVEKEPETLSHFCEEFKALKTSLGIKENGFPVIHSDILETKTQIFYLEIEIASLEIKKAELEKLILEFEIQLKIEMGELMLEKLALEKQLQEQVANLTQKQGDLNVLEEKQRNIDSFYEVWRDAIKRSDISLNPNEEEEIKKLYREAMMMAHPDRFMNDPKKYDDANRLSALLSEAYKQKDFSKVREIWSQLKNGFAFKADWFSNNDENFFKKLLNHLLDKKEQLGNEVLLLQQHIAISINAGSGDYGAYFNQLRTTLQANISILKNEINKYKYE